MNDGLLRFEIHNDLRNYDKYHYYKRKGEEINNYIKERYGTTHQKN